jgi:hypothetical protein
VLMHADNTDEDISISEPVHCVRLSKKRAAPARPFTTVSAFETRLRPSASPCKPCDNRGNQARDPDKHHAQVEGSGTGFPTKPTTASLGLV